MILYYSVFGLLVALGNVARRGSIYWLVLLGLIVFAGFRYEVGCDWSGYLQNWQRMYGVPVQGAVTMTEPAHWVVIALLQELGLSYTYLLVVASAIFFAGLNAMARRQPDPIAVLVLAFPILILNMPMSGIRQAEAIGIMCFAFNAFVDKRIFRYVALVLLATLFHRSAIVFLALTPLVPIGFDKKNVALAILLALPGVYLMMQSSAADEAASRYVDTGLDAAGAAFRLMILVLSGGVYLIKLAPGWRAQYPGDYKLATIGAWLMVGLIGLFLVSSVIGDRFGYYLIPLQLVIFARIPYLPALRSRRLWGYTPYAVLILAFLVWTQKSWHFQECYLPYRIGIYQDG